MRQNVLTNEATGLDNAMPRQHDTMPGQLTPEMQQLVARHMPMAQKMVWRLKDYGVGLNDLQQEACMGLCEAAPRYDAKSEASFATYARHWCRKRMLLAIERYGAPMQLPAKERIELRFYSLDLDTNSHDEEDDGMADRLQSGICIEQDNSEAIRRGQLQRLDEAMACLAPQEQEIVRLVHGLDGNPVTTTEAATAMGLSKQRASVIHRNALRKLNDALAKRPLAEYLSPWT